MHSQKMKAPLPFSLVMQNVLGTSNGGAIMIHITSPQVPAYNMNQIVFFALHFF